MKEKPKKGILNQLLEKPAEPPYRGAKGNWKVLDGDWVWVPTDKKGVPLSDEGRPILPEDER